MLLCRRPAEALSLLPTERHFAGNLCHGLMYRCIVCSNVCVMLLCLRPLSLWRRLLSSICSRQTVWTLK
ncbi:hypothetical protein NDU88_001747 [Pleurodeles waltl]|uniref:Uncharacterized protein n=1 Tax=Pleurodeles waltl TaxID=8319 RepID=A0AAV7UTM5_PLEWA|nr:hypothetical protein NDU88_001747 [Pleurodeles waltl]